ncbi:hypothetical protein CEUSTIGMA_g9418.t1 [Chlamydomonas eustigma]|uniref:Sister chromatid cohesion protein DCC1 n=1 Tax=Chlamydomonas eustigma TaxID=1157962 RepID=A0A250XGS4_9CHLO|nr:hypothetical protein CEUSTIGMA_g9418.t1 [Chlamydomonas eustigma]|eukprot:GAX81990.1 hypothetical protein CEUSTIGMA_g9418.t1 [Chlamydomonas eustigma]
MDLDHFQPRKLAYGEDVRSDYRLLECSEELLDTILREGTVIKGGENDEAVLCTRMKTYALKYVETTNMQLLVSPDIGGFENAGNDDIENSPYSMVNAPGLQTQIQKLSRCCQKTKAVTVTATNQSHLEAVEIAPRLGALEALLLKRPYGLADEQLGEVEEDTMADPCSSAVTGTEGLHTFRDLLERVQASEEELRAGLRSLGAIELNGSWRTVDPQYLGSLLELIISSCQQLGHSFIRVPATEVCESLRECGVNPAIAMHCLEAYGSPAGDDISSSNPADTRCCAAGSASKFWALNESKVCKYFAGKLLTCGRQMSTVEFMNKLKDAVPDGMQPSLESLKGEVLMTGKSQNTQVKAFPLSALPREPAKRFAALFAERPKWNADDMEPYISDLKVPGLTTGALLLKYARVSQTSPQDPIIYSMR